MILKRAKTLCLPVLCCMALTLVLFQMPAQCHAFEINIDVAPNVLNIQSNGTVVTVHTDIAYGSVNFSTVYLNGLAIDSWKADDRGNFVAKFLMDAVKTLDGLVIGGYNTLTLVGVDTDGEAFSGTQDILVIDNIPKGR